jgi:hypothetical protein
MSKRKRKIIKNEENYCSGCFEKESDVGLLKPCLNEENYCNGCFEKESDVGLLKPCLNSGVYEYLDNEESEPLYCAACWNREMEFRRFMRYGPISPFDDALTSDYESANIGETQ